MDSPSFQSGVELTAAYEVGDASPVDAVQRLFAQIERLNPAVNAFYAVDRDGALAAARASEERWRRGRPASALDGVPVSIKDHIAVRGMPVTWGCRRHADPPPAAEDSAVVARLREAGAIVFGKTTMCELGFYPGSVSPRYGPCRNPWSLAKTSGGSSGGATAAVSSGLGPISIGSDGGGSIRIPASYTATLGFKPSGGRVPVTPPLGVNPSVGPITRTVRDAAEAMNVITQPDDRDFLALPRDGRDYRAALGRSIEGVRIGVLTSMGYGVAPSECVAAAFERACGVLASAGAAVESLPAPFDPDVFDALAPAMLPGYVQRFMDVADGRRDDLLDSTTQLIDYALALTIADLVAANRALAQSVARFMSLLTTVEYLVTPTLATTAFDAELLFPANEPRNAWGYAFGFASFVPFANFCALPACSICCGFDAQTLPIGLQIVGRRYDDFGVLKIASAYEERRAFDVSWPCVTEPACEAREGVSCSPN